MIDSSQPKVLLSPYLSPLPPLGSAGAHGVDTPPHVQPTHAPEPTDEVCRCLADRFFDTSERAAEGLTIKTSASGGAILLDLETFATDLTLTHVERGKAVFRGIVECVASTLASGGVPEADALAAAHALATQLGTPEFAELPGHAVTSAMPTSLAGTPRSSTHFTLMPEAKVRVRHELAWTQPIDSSPPPDGAVETEKTVPAELNVHIESVIWLEREIGPVSLAQAGGAARFAWHVQVERVFLTNLGADVGAELISGRLGFDNQVCDALARGWGNAGFCVVPPSVVNDPPGETEVPRAVPPEFCGANWRRPQPLEVPGRALNEPQSGDVAEHPVPPLPQGGAERPSGPVLESMNQVAVPGPGLESISAPPHGPQASASSASAPDQVASSDRGWWTPTLYGSWTTAAGAYLSATAVQFVEKFQALGAAAAMLIYPVMQGGAIAEVVTVWWLGRKRAAEQKERDEKLADVAAGAAAFREADNKRKEQASLLKAQAAERQASGGPPIGSEGAVDDGGQTDVSHELIQRNEADKERVPQQTVKPAEAALNEAKAALKEAELKTLSAVASLPARADQVWYQRDVYVQAVATAVRLLNWAGTKFGFLISPLLGALTGVFGAVGGVFHIWQGTIERRRATQDAHTLGSFKDQVLGPASGKDADLNEATVKGRLTQLDGRLHFEKFGPEGKVNFRALLGQSEAHDLRVASKLADVVHAKLSTNADRLIAAAQKQRRNANIRIGFGTGTVGLSTGLAGLAYFGAGAGFALLVPILTTAVVTLAVGWLGFAVAEWVRAGRETQWVTEPTPEDKAKIAEWANADLATLEQQFLEQANPEEFFIGALMARYLALSTKFDGQEESSTQLDVQQRARRVTFSKIRVKMTKRMCMQAALDQFRALREVSAAAVKNTDKKPFIDIVTSITQHIEGKQGLQSRLAAAANLPTASGTA